jgi:hypothetical protein
VERAAADRADRANDLAKLASLYKDSGEAKKASGGFEQRLAELDQSAAKVLGAMRRGR